MAKQLIRLTESDLHRIVKESVNTLLKEFFFLKTDPSQADNEEEHESITKMRQRWQKEDAKEAEKKSPAHDNREAAKTWVTKKSGQYMSPKKMRKKTKDGDF
jgi:hypothetical protein